MYNLAWIMSKPRPESRFRWVECDNFKICQYYPNRSFLKKVKWRNSLAVQWLGWQSHCCSPGSILGQGTKDPTGQTLQPKKKKSNGTQCIKLEANSSFRSQTKSHFSVAKFFYLFMEWVLPSFQDYKIVVMPFIQSH